MRKTQETNPFAVLDNRPPAVFQQSLRLVADNSALNPVYCPPHIQIAWASEGGTEGSINELKHEKGYELATMDMVTADVREAMDKGLICLRAFGPDTTNRYVKHRELFLMVTKREWWENRMKLMAQEAANQVAGVSTSVPGATVTHESYVGPINEADRYDSKEE